MLHLKKVEGGKTQLLVRAETNLGNILLNIFINDKMNVVKRKNNLQFGCIPNPPIKGTKFFYVKFLANFSSNFLSNFFRGTRRPSHYVGQS